MPPPMQVRIAAVAALPQGEPVVPAGELDGSICKPFCQKENVMAVVIIFGIVGAVVVTSFLLVTMFLDVTVGECLSVNREAMESESPRSMMWSLARQFWQVLPICLIDVILLIGAAGIATA